MKKTLLVFLILSLVCVFNPYAYATNADGEGVSNFSRVNEYIPGQFSDVNPNDWYAENVREAYERNLVKGSSPNTFNPKGNITIAEVITIASRLHSIYYSAAQEFPESSPWYRVYVEYAVNNEIIASSQFSDYNRKATRSEFATIMARAFPEASLTSINSIEKGKIPDIPLTASYLDAVYLLYNAGVLTGNDKYGTFTPESNIQRSAVAAIATRMASPVLRKHFELEQKNTSEEGVANKEPNFLGSRIPLAKLEEVISLGNLGRTFNSEVLNEINWAIRYYKIEANYEMAECLVNAQINLKKVSMYYQKERDILVQYKNTYPAVKHIDKAISSYNDAQKIVVYNEGFSEKFATTMHLYRCLSQISEFGSIGADSYQLSSQYLVDNMDSILYNK